MYWYVIFVGIMETNRDMMLRRKSAGRPGKGYRKAVLLRVGIGLYNRLEAFCTADGYVSRQEWLEGVLMEYADRRDSEESERKVEREIVRGVEDFD